MCSSFEKKVGKHGKHKSSLDEKQRQQRVGAKGVMNPRPIVLHILVGTLSSQQMR